MKDCPIGLICDYFECNVFGGCTNRAYCQELAKPWTLPYWVEPCWMPGVGLLVTLPACEWDCANEEHEIAIQDRYNEWVERIREDYWLGGWWEATDLPYQPHPDGGLLVIHQLRLDKDITFSCPWRDIRKRSADTYPECWEQFTPPVRLNRHRHPWDKKIQDDGFYPPWVLVFASDFEEDEEY